jgi:outer membrane receptor protein involved in Fe transport
VGNVFSFSQINSPQNTLVSKNGQEECFQYPYTAFERDKLYGSTFSFIHPIGDSLINFTYDFHGQSTFAYFNAPDNISVPLSTDRYSTFSLTGELHVAPKVSVNAGLYDTLWSVSGVQPLLVGGSPVLDANNNPLLTGLGRHISRFDPHVAVVLRPSSATSLRAAWGTSATFPFVGQVSGNASYQPYAQSAPLYTAGILSEKNPSLEPEVSLAYDLGADHRFANGSVLSGDLQDTIIHNVFQALTLAETVPFTSSCVSAPCIEGISSPINVARLRTQMATLKYRYAPRTGFGFNLSAAAVRSIVDGIPVYAYNSSPSFPVNNVQICGNGLSTPGIPTCIPYLKGYGQLTYTTRDGTYAALGLDYEGKNNAYFQPPFSQLDLTVRRPVTHALELLVSVQNLLNTNNYDNLPAPNAGVPLTAETNTGLVSYPSELIPAPPRTVRVQMRLHMGR